ncbi:hypothetical protein ABEF95_007818 [Exophiala dermatitidis]
MSLVYPNQGRSTTEVHLPSGPVNISQVPQDDNVAEPFVDIAALTITFVLIGAFIAVLFYAWRKRCDGRRNACGACHKRQHSNLSYRDDDLEDAGLIFDGKDVAGKQD